MNQFLLHFIYLFVILSAAKGLPYGSIINFSSKGRTGDNVKVWIASSLGETCHCHDVDGSLLLKISYITKGDKEFTGWINIDCIISYISMQSLHSGSENNHSNESIQESTNESQSISTGTSTVTGLVGGGTTTSPTNSTHDGGGTSHLMGIRNLGRTCYANVCLQRLFLSKPIRESILCNDLKSVEEMAGEMKNLNAQISFGQIHQDRVVITPEKLANGLHQLKDILICMKNDRQVNTQLLMDAFGINTKIDASADEFWRIIEFYLDYLDISESYTMTSNSVMEEITDRIDHRTSSNAGLQTSIQVTVPRG